MPESAYDTVVVLLPRNLIPFGKQFYNLYIVILSILACTSAAVANPITSTSDLSKKIGIIFGIRV